MVLNHIYEHVVDPDAVLREIRRVLAPDGVVYLGLANRLGVVEPHYRLPFLSWLPHGPLADRYVRASAAPTTTTSGSAPAPACAGSSPASTAGTTPFPCSPTRWRSTAGTSCRVPSHGSRPGC